MNSTRQKYDRISRTSNILILIDNFRFGGAQRAVLDIVRKLDKDLFNITVVGRKGGGFLPEFERLENVKTINLERELKGYDIIKTIFELNRIVRINKIDIIHTNLPFSDFCGFILKLLNPGVKLLSKRGTTGPYRKKIYKRLLNWFISLPVEIIVCVSREVRDYIHKYEFIPYKKLIVIFNGVDVSEIENTDVNVKEKKRELGINEIDLVIGSVGRLTKQKGFEYLLSAFKRVNEEFSHSKLVIVGAGKLEYKLKQQAKDLNLGDNVIFTGKRKDVYGILKIFDVFVMASLWEGMSHALLEAMSAKLPIVATNVSGTEEVVENNITGFLIKSRDIEKLSEGMIRLLRDDGMRENFGEMGYRKIKQEFDIEFISRNYQEVYLGLLDQEKR